MNFDEIIDRRGTYSVKWERYRGRDVIPLWVADMDFRSPPAVIDALVRRVEHGIFGYTHVPDELTAAVTRHLLADFSWKTEGEWIVWLPGVVPGLNTACRIAGDAGDEIVTMVPVYPPFLTAPEHFRRNIIPVQLTNRESQWAIDFEALERAITPRTRLLLLCNPHNPVGRAYSRQELSNLAALCKRTNLMICSDDIHAGLLLDSDRQHIPIASLSPDTAARTITLFAPSKTYNIPGLGCAFAVIPCPDLRLRFTTAMRGIVPAVNALGYTAALAAYRDSHEWHNELLCYLRNHRTLVEETVAGIPGLEMHHVEATYLAWIDTRDSGIDNPAAFFEQAGVGLSDGVQFGGPGFVRLNFACPRTVLETALSRMATALRGR